MRLLKTGSRAGRERLEALINRRQASEANVLPAVRRIVNDVRVRGDAALRRYAKRLDGLAEEEPLRIEAKAMQEALDSLAAPLRDAMRTAAKNVRRFAERQMPKSWTAEAGRGLTTGQMVHALDAVGCYVPAGRYPLPSTLLMTAIPAQVAGVRRIVVVSPRPVRETLAAAALVGVSEFYAVGGAHAVAALAYGTQTVARVDKIAGPGSSFVTAAKRLVSSDCAIDMLAGPTEILVYSVNGRAATIAADLIAQAEHDADALAVFVTTNDLLAGNVLTEVKLGMRKNAAAAEALRRNGCILVARSVDEAREITNRLAVEHLTVDSEEDLNWVRNAGSVFVGPWSPQAMGDYVSGPNHTLPTGGLARVRGGLSVMDFVKLITVQRYERDALLRLGPSAIALAEAEGLRGHAEAVRTAAEGDLG